jgi:hypothetical protein
LVGTFDADRHVSVFVGRTELVKHFDVQRSGLGVESATPNLSWQRQAAIRQMTQALEQRRNRLARVV